MKLPRKLKKLYKKMGVPYWVSKNEFNNYIKRKECLDQLYPHDYDHHKVFKKLKKTLNS